MLWSLSHSLLPIQSSTPYPWMAGEGGDVHMDERADAGGAGNSVSAAEEAD